MKTAASFMLLGCSLSMTTLACSADMTSSPTGYWKTIDDVSEKPKSIVHISETANHTLVGEIIKIYPRQGYAQNEVCSACKGDRHNQRIIGMVFLQGLKQSGDNFRIWTNGKILDPMNGKTYSCNVTLAKNNKQLNVKDYMGVPLFGHSQTWVRIADINKI